MKKMRSDLEYPITVSSSAPAPCAAEGSENPLDLASPCCTSNDSSCFKENFIISKCETPKLSVEPLQMKRKKKGGVYNLRKSLAWDRAFFTEEGVLDPIELSVISGVSCREGLTSISEDTPGGSQQDEDLGKDRNKDLSPKHNSSFSNLRSTSLKKIPIHVGHKPGSRCGDSPRLLPSSSLKRPANVNAGKASGKELKLPKLPGLKPGLSPTCASTRSTKLRANRVKHNQITQPDFSILRHAKLKSSCKSLLNTQNASRANSLQSAHHSDGNLGNPSFKRYSSINMSPMLVDKADNSSSNMISDNSTHIRPENSSKDQGYDSTTFAAPFSKNAHIHGRAMHPLQNQTTKPSGLRMPSPSLSFFSQPKPSVFRNYPLRNAKGDVFESQKPGSLRLQDNLRTPKMCNRILESTTSSSEAISSRSACMASSQVSAIELIRLSSERNPMHKVGIKIQDLPKKNIIARISHEEAELLKIGIEVPSQSGRREQATDNFSKKSINGYPVNSESCGSEGRNPELGLKQNCAFQESEALRAIAEPPKEKNTCELLVLNHGSTRCTDTLDDRLQMLPMQSDWGKPSKSDCCELHKEKTEPLDYSLGETGDITNGDKNILKTKKRASGQLALTEQSGTCCNGSTKASEQRKDKAEIPYFGSKHLSADLLKEIPSLEALTDNLPVGEDHMHDSLFTSTVGSYNDIDLMPEVVDDFKQSGKGADAQSMPLKVAKESGKLVELNTSDRLSLGKNISLQNSVQEENVEKLLIVVPDRTDRTDGNNLIEAKMRVSLSPGKSHDSNLGKEKIIAQPLISVELDSVDSSLASENCNSLINSIKGNGNLLLNGTASENLSNCLHQNNQNMDTDDCSPLPEIRIHQPSQKITLGKITEEGTCIQDGSADNIPMSTVSLENNESDINNLSVLKDTGTLLVQSPESNMSNDCCFKHSNCIALANDEFVAGNLVHRNDQLQRESPSSVYSGYDALRSTRDSDTGQNDIHLSISESSSVSAKEAPLKHETHNDADAITDLSRVEPFSDTINSEVSEDTNNSFSCLHPKLDHIKVEAALAPSNKHGDALNEKSRSLVLPQNAVPFSDEWLAAVEAAGEDILTRKSGAVQNSPTDKSLPVPSPWSPVKRKNNEIGPFDCTKSLRHQT